jgi:hypothetical protein
MRAAGRVKVNCPRCNKLLSAVTLRAHRCTRKPRRRATPEELAAKAVVRAQKKFDALCAARSSAETIDSHDEQKNAE